MKTFRAPILLAVALSLCSCQVLEQAELCGQLAKMLEQRRAKLAPALPADPSPQALDHKARLYRELARDMESLSVGQKAIAEGRDEIVDLLGKLVEQLERASKAVEVHREEEAEQSRRRAEKKQAAKAKREGGKVAAPPRSDEGKSKAPDSKKAERDHAASSAREVLPVKEEDATKRRRKGNSERKPDRPRRHGKRDYQRARSAAESTGRALEKAVDELSRTCS